MLFNTGVGAVWRCLYCGFSDLVKEPFALLSIIVALLILDWKLTLVGLGFLPLTFAILYNIIFLNYIQVEHK